MLKYIYNYHSDNFRKKSLLREFSFHYEYFGSYIEIKKNSVYFTTEDFFTQFIMS